MKLRTKLTIFTVTAICGSLGILAWSVNRFVRQQLGGQQTQEADTLAAQVRREFKRSGDEVVYALQGIAEAEGTLRMAIDLSRAQSDPSVYARDAQAIAESRQLDFLEFYSDDGTLISSAQWPGRIGFKNGWVTQQSDWNQQGAFLERVELPDKVDLGLLAVRLVTVGEKKLYVVGGRRLDSDFLQTTAVPAGMQVLFYRNLESGFVPEALVDSRGPAEQPERFASVMESIERQPRAGEYDVPGAAAGSAERFLALPLTGRNNELLAAVLVGGTPSAAMKSSTYIRNAGLAIGTAAVLLAFIFSWSLSRQMSGSLERLARASRELGAGRWNAKVETRGGGEAGNLARAFNEMTTRLSAKREKLVQAERVAAWRELARNFALDLKLPLFSLQVALENVSRAREETPERFDEAFRESLKMANTEMENLKGIIGRFSDFAKMGEPKLQAVNVNEVLRATVKAFEPQFQLRGRPPVKPELLLDDHAARISADPELLHKGFDNVIANSLSAMPMGGTLTIRTAQKNGIVRVDISDTGSGLETSDPVIPGVPYVAKQEGAGFGLATIQGVVSDHGGRMSVERTGAGTTFHMEFPVGSSTKTYSTAASAAAPKAESGSGQAKTETERAPKQQAEALPETKPALVRTMDI